MARLAKKGLKDILQKSGDDVVFLSALRTPTTRSYKGGLKDAYDHELLYHVRLTCNCTPQWPLTLHRSSKRRGSLSPPSIPPRSTISTLALSSPSLAAPKPGVWLHSLLDIRPPPRSVPSTGRALLRSPQSAQSRLRFCPVRSTLA